MPTQAGETKRYDAFISYNSQDHVLVEDIARQLKAQGLTLFLDRWSLIKGRRWRPALEDMLNTCRSVIIFIGPDGQGPWQQREIDAALDRQARDPNFPVITVLLHGGESPLGFLKQITWIDFRDIPLDQGISLLVKSVHGEPPGSDLQEQFAAAHNSICPYRGLLYFREEDSAFFFGRDKTVNELCEYVSQHSFVAVVGASGSGKSSVVRAGLVPRLRKERDHPWEVVTLIPGNQPMRALVEAFLPFLDPDITEHDRLLEISKYCRSLSAEKDEERIRLADIIRRVLEKQVGTDRLLLIVDQWEELYTGTQDAVLCQRFIDELLDATARAPLKIIVTLRGDFVGKALGYRPLCDRLQGSQVNLGPMNRTELLEVIHKPASKVGLTFDEGLAELIVNDVGHEPGNLPLLEFVLRRLWDERHHGTLLHDAYRKMGGLKGAIAAKTEDFYLKLSSPEQAAVHRLFLQLVNTSEEGRDSRRRERLLQIPSTAWALVDILADKDHRLLVKSHLKLVEEATVEVAHEALLSHWKRLREWINLDREFLLWQKRLRVQIDAWKGIGRNEDGLLRGPLLDEAERWWGERSEQLSPEEREYVKQCQTGRNQRRLAETEQRERELQKERQLRDAEAARAQEAEKRAEEAEAHGRNQAEGRQKLENGRIHLYLATSIAAMLAVTALVAWRQAVARGQDLQVTLRDSLVHQAVALRQSTRRTAAIEALKNAVAIRPDIDLREEYLRSLDLPALMISPPPAMGTSSMSSNAASQIDSTVFGEQLEARRSSSWEGPVSRSPNGKWIVGVQSGSQSAAIFAVSSEKDENTPLKDAKGNSLSPVCIAWNGKSDKLAAVSKLNARDKYQIFVFDVTPTMDAKISNTWVFEADGVDSIELNDSATVLAVSAWRRSTHAVYLWNVSVEPKEHILTLESRLNSWSSGDVPGRLEFSPSGSDLIAAGRNGTIKVWHLNVKDVDKSQRRLGGDDDEERLSWKAHVGEVYNVSLSPDGRWLATTGRDGWLRLWSFQSGFLGAELRIEQRNGHRRDNLSVMWDGSESISAWGHHLIFLPPLSNTYVFEEDSLNSRAEDIGFLQFDKDERRAAIGGKRGQTFSLIDLTKTESKLTNFFSTTPAYASYFERSKSVLHVAGIGNVESLHIQENENVATTLEVDDNTRHVVALTENTGGALIAAGIQTRCSVDLFDAKTQEALWSFSERGRVGLIPHPIFSGDGNRLAVPWEGTSGDSIKVWDVKSRDPAADIQIEDARYIFFRDRSLMGVVDPNTMSIKNLDLDEALLPIRHANDNNWFNGDLIFSSDGQKCAEVTDTKIVIWDLLKRVQKVEIMREHASERHLDMKAFNFDGSLFAAVDGNQTRIWKTDDGEKIASLNVRPRCLAFVKPEPDGERLYMVKSNGEVLSWLPATDIPIQLCMLDYQIDEYSHCTIAPNGSRLFVASDLVRVWELPSGSNISTILSPNGSGERFATDGSGAKFATLNEHEFLSVWNLKNGETLLELKEEIGFLQARDVCFSGDGNLLALRKDQREHRGQTQIEIWDIAAKQIVFDHSVDGYEFEGEVRLSDDGQFVALAHRNRVLILEPKSKREVPAFERVGAHFASLSFNKKGTLLAALSVSDATVQLIRPATGELITTFHSNIRGATQVALSPNGRWLGVGGAEGRIRIWDLSQARKQLSEVGLDWED